jgi:hypothetical protein
MGTTRRRRHDAFAPPSGAVVGWVGFDRHTRHVTEHDGFEHVLPNGDILIVESTIKDERVERAFAAVRQELREKGRRAYEQLRSPAKDTAV